MKTKIQSRIKPVTAWFKRACGTGLAIAASGVAFPAYAVVTDIVIHATAPYGVFAGGKFLRIDGEARGLLAPSEAIADIDKPARDASGQVPYKTRFTLLMPEAATGGNGTLLVDVVNRGRAITHAFYNSPRARPVLTGSLDEGTGFLQNRGYAVVAVQWELAEGFEPPTFVDAQADKRFVEGAGFAAVRDIAVFFRGDDTAANPLARRIERVYATGYSQTARLLKSFLAQGFNEFEGKRVFDALHLVAGTAGVLPLNASGKGPGSVASATPGPANAELRGVHEEPFTYAEVMQRVRERNRSVPLVMVANMNTDYLSTRTSLIRTGASGTAEVPIPGNVRMYDIAGAAHMNVRAKDKACEEEHGQLDWSPALRAQLVALDAWARGAAEPPASRLMPLEPNRSDPKVLAAPKFLPGAVVLVPKVDTAGNSLGGVRLPDFEVALGQHGDLNGPMSNGTCRLAGSYRPFAKTAAERQARGDPRPSIEERYPGGINEYTTRIRQAARALVADRLLLEEDSAVIQNAAAENPLFAPTQARTRGALGGAQR